MILERTSVISATLPEVFRFFSDPRNLGKITPPEMGFRITSIPPGPLKEGDTIDYTIRILGLPLKWRTCITMWRPDQAFADRQERGPYRLWLHTHTFRAVDGGVEMHDHVEYELPLGLAGRIFGGWLVKRQLKTIFDFREMMIARYFAGDQTGLSR